MTEDYIKNFEAVNLAKKKNRNIFRDFWLLSLHLHLLLHLQSGHNLGPVHVQSASNLGTIRIHPFALPAEPAAKGGMLPR